MASAQQKQEVKATNRFLVNTEFKKPEETSGDEKNYSFTKLVHYVGQKSTSSAAAQREYDSLKQRLFEQTLRNYVQNSINELNGFLVENFGFYTVKKEDFLWILDAKTDEGKTQSEAIEAVRMLFKEMKANESTETLEKQLQPLIDYFESLKKKYTENDKGSRKMRYSAYYNLGKIYYYLDKPEKVIKEAQEQGIEQLFLEKPLLFSELLLEGRKKQFEEALNFPGEIVFLDRGLPDVLAYMNYIGDSYPPLFDKTCKEYRYESIFLLPPWEEIYTSDEHRYENFEQAKLIYNHLKETYQNFGYLPIEVPQDTVANRILYILDKISN